MAIKRLLKQKKIEKEARFSIEELKKMMHQAALELDFERAAMLRDKIHELEHQ